MNVIGKIFIRKMKDADEDYNLILKWYKNPKVADYFDPIIKTKEEAIKKYLPRIKGISKKVPLIIEFNEKPIGYVQYAACDVELLEKLNLKKYCNVYGIDIFIGEAECYNKGIGSSCLKFLVRYLFKIKNAEMVIIDPETRNKVAIRCYKKVGFIPLLKMVVDGDEKLYMYIKRWIRLILLKILFINFFVKFIGF